MNQRVIGFLNLGTTRDRKLGHGYLAGMPIEVIDTGGLDDRGAVSSQVQTQVELAMNESDVVLFMLDSRVGVTALDLHFARWIRKTVHEKGDPSNNNKREVVILANKAEGAHMSEQIMDTFAEASRLGFGEPLLISASHGYTGSTAYTISFNAILCIVEINIDDEIYDRAIE